MLIESAHLADPTAANRPSDGQALIFAYPKQLRAAWAKLGSQMAIKILGVTAIGIALVCFARVAAGLAGLM